ncbi:MAG: HAD family hydrolase [Paludisphaera borealis]|uniref:HAD family hydrolase n=1 Tax=Paludisphaera borealis TaxID=1387353 RepID=UPI002841EBC2|nr:HAD family hydrolase [Paludisphaera borealis]MDR3621236.1 HAD family hydrolase [Paludisphaera borealis]
MTTARGLTSCSASATAAVLLTSLLSAPAFADDPLASWNESPTKRAVVSFVERVTKQGGPDFVPVADRVAAFDNDGTLWSEQPTYVQAAFLIDRVKALAAEHPDWKDKQPFKSVIENGLEGTWTLSTHQVVEIVAATHTGMDVDAFQRIVEDWLTTAEHPRFKKPYTELVYQPMLELLAYLRANGFKTYIVSGGGVEFMRPWAERVYGVPPEQVVGSSVKVRYEEREGKPVLIRLPEVAFIDDRAGKPDGIYRAAGRRPIAAFGNSDGDYELLRWTTAGPGPRLGLIVHHTDADREWAYDRNSHSGRLAKALDEAPARGWLVVDMKNDWKTVFRFQR